MIGETISHYRIVEKLGEGGMGVVYRAVDTRLDRPVAIKVLTAEAVAHPERKKRFMQEARTASALNHPNIITIYDIGCVERPSGPLDFIAMEYVRGRSLSELIGSTGLRVPEVLKYATQIADALTAAHAAGIIHRDLKPGNLMVTGPESGHPGLVKVLDFGVAKLADPTDSTESAEMDAAAPTRSGLISQTPRTAEGSILGTVAYMSPEQAEGRRVDARSDIFSFGAVLYEMLTGRQAFRGGSRLSILTAILRDDPQPAGELVRDVPPELETIVTRCLRKDPERRFQSAADVRVLLQEISDRALVESLPLSSEGRARPAARPRRRWWWAVPALIVLLALIPALRKRAPGWLSSGRVPAQKQIVVLPFQNVGGDSANQPFCDGLAETLTSALTELEQFHGSLWVVPSSEVRKESVSSARTAQRVFGVNLVITGSVQRTGDLVRVTANLVDAATLRQLGARTLDTRPENLTALQDGVVTQIADLLELELKPQAQRLLASSTTAKPSAYDFYLQGRGTLQRTDKPGNAESAIGLFERALGEDPNYALAYAGLSEAYLRRYSQTREAQWLDQARQSASRALEINDRLAPAHVDLGVVHAAMGQTEAAIGQFLRALDLDPVNADAYRELGSAYETAGRLEQAESTYRKALQLRPSDWVSYTTLGIFYIRRSRYADAEPLFRRVTELTPDSAVAYRNLGGLYLYMARYEEGAAALEKSVAIKPSAAAYSNLATMYYFQGRYRQAAGMNEKSIELAGANNPNDYILWGNLGDSCRWTPELADKAPDAYRRAIQLAQRHLQVNPNNARILATVAGYHAKLAENDKAEALIAKARRLAPTDHTIGFKSVLVYELTNRRDRALAALESLLKGGYSIEEIRREPELAQLRRDPRYERLIAALPQTARH